MFFNSWMPNVTKKSSSVVTDPRSYGLIGDSHNNYWTSAPTLYCPFGDQWNNHCYLQYWNMYTNWRYYITVNLSVGGKRTDEILTEQVPNLLAARPGFVIEASGTNDGIQGVSLSVIIANTKKIYDTILASGIQLRIYIAPIWTTGITLARAQIMLQLREWKYDYAKRNPGVIIYDHHQILVDYASATASAKSGYLRDGVHTNHIAAFLGGKAFAEQDMSRLGSFDPENPDYDSTVGISAGPASDDLRQLYRFPGLPGSAAETNPGMSGTRPGNGWYGIRGSTGTGVCSVSVVGNGWQRFSINKSGPANGDYVSQGYGFSAGDFTVLAGPSSRRRLVQLSLTRKQSSSVGVRGDNINFGITVNGVSHTLVSNANYGTSASVYPNGIDKTLEWRSPIIIIPANGVVSSGSFAIISTFDAGGSVVDEIEKVRLLDISRLYDGV